MRHRWLGGKVCLKCGLVRREFAPGSVNYRRRGERMWRAIMPPCFGGPRGDKK